MGRTVEEIIEEHRMSDYIGVVVPPKLKHDFFQKCNELGLIPSSEIRGFMSRFAYGNPTTDVMQEINLVREILMDLLKAFAEETNLKERMRELGRKVGEEIKKRENSHD